MKSKNDIRDKEAIERLVSDALGHEDCAAVVNAMFSAWRQTGHSTDAESKELMIEAIRLQNEPGISEQDVIETLFDRALPLPATSTNESTFICDTVHFCCPAVPLSMREN